MEILVGCLVIFGIALLIGIIFVIVEYFSIVWGVLHGWVYLLILIGAIILLMAIRYLFESLIYNRFTPTQQAILKSAKDKLEEEREDHKRKVNKIVQQKRIELEKENSSIIKTIQELEDKKKVFQENINKNTVLNASDLKTNFSFYQSELLEGKVFTLIRYLETNRADTIKDALSLYDMEEAEIWNEAKRKYDERMAQQKEDSFKEEQLRLLREQNKQIAKAREEMEEANKKILRQNEELLKKIDNE